MRRVQCAVVVAAVLLIAGTVSADAIDPQIIIRSGVFDGTIHITNQAATVNLQFTSNLTTVVNQGCSTYTPASAPTNSGFDEMGCPVVNDTPTALAGLVFHFSQAYPVNLLVADCPVTICTSSSISPDGRTITFVFIPGLIYGTTDPRSGGMHGEDFFVTFAGFTEGDGINVTVVPEPGTMLLMLGGLGVLGLRRRKQVVS